MSDEMARKHQETVQCYVRLTIVVAGTLYLSWLRTQPDVPNEENLVLGQALALASAVFSASLLAASRFDWPPMTLRLGVGVLHDVALVSCAMYFGEAGSAAFAFLWVLITLTNGFRYGAKYLYYTAVLSIVGFGAVYLASPYWRDQTILSINLFFVLTIIPIYLGRLLESIQLANSRLRSRASEDPLTGLLNRAGLETRLHEVVDGTGNQSDLAFLYCDLDRFKDVNDRAGHAAGDKMLVDLAAIIAKCVRKNDLCARIGGDEFCVVLRDCRLERAKAIAESVRSTVSAYRLAWSNEYFSVGISIGVAPLSAVADVPSLIRLADAACYAAKNAGRNQIHVVDPRLDDIDTQRVRHLGGASEHRSDRSAG